MSEELWRLLKIIQSAASKAMSLLGPEITEIKVEDASVKSVLTISDNNSGPVKSTKLGPKVA